MKEVILTILGSGACSAIISHLMYSKKLKKDLNYRGNDVIAQDIQKSLKHVRNMELKLTSQELFMSQNELEQRGSDVNFFGGECIYLSIFNNWNSYYAFLEHIQNCRKFHEKNLSCKIALNLVFIERYIMQLGLFMKEHGDENMMPVWGMMFICDLNRWQKNMDKLIVKEINKHNFKLESHETIKWKIYRKFILEKQYENTILYYLITSKYKLKNRRIILGVNKFLEQIDKDFDKIENA